MKNGFIPDAPEGECFPLTDAQAEKWLGSHYSEQAALAFCEAFEIVFEGPLDTGRLAAALDALARRHEIFSVGFAADGRTQVHFPDGAMPLLLRDYSAEADPLAAYRAYCERERNLPFDLGRPPLIRACLCRLAPGSHRLFMSAHHLVFDGWSLRLALKDLAAFYAADGQDLPNLRPADSWIAYARAERERRDGPEGLRCLEYWKARFGSVPEPLRLPTDRPRTGRIDFSAANFTLPIEPALWQSLRGSARASSVTRFTLLLAGYFILLHRLSGQRDLVCGVPFAGAAQRGARVIGDTDNTLPLRIEVVPDESAAALALRVQAALKEAADHQDISLGRIVDALRLPREAGRMLLVESIVTLVPQMEKLEFEGLESSLEVLPRTTAAWELGFYWRQMPAGLLLEVQYQRALYDESTVRDWAAHYLEILRGLTDQAHLPVAELGLPARPDPASYALVNEHAPSCGQAASLPALLEDAFRRHAQRIAACCGDGSSTYAALEASSRRIAAGLVARGVARGDLVGVAVPRGLDMLAAVLAVMRAGAAYVPLDPTFPEQRLRRMAEHSGLAAIVTGKGATLPDSVTAGRDCWPVGELAAHGGDEPLPAVGPEDLAYVLYTSGSTGEPKGVRILHRNLVNFLCSMRESPGFSADDAICSATTLSFDIAALELYLPLISGGQVVIADDDQHRDPEALCRLIESTGCTVFQTTPSLMALLHEVGRIEALAPLRLLVGGEALPPALARSLAGRCRELWNMYGPTETTVWSSIQRILPGAAAVPLGRPIARTRLYVLDEHRRPALPHALGEIWIDGAGVADGYLHRPDLSAERFLADPFAGDGSLMYRTGDLGRLHEGDLHFHGRADDQIKLRGYRIEPGDIEAVAAAEADVAECVVVVRTLAGGDQVLALYAGSERAAAELAPRLRKRLQQSLPAYMRPQHVTVLPSLPKTPNGKIDRRALPPPAEEAQAVSRRRLPPRDDLERMLCGQWQRLLQREAVGVEDDFFELGGYSLLAVRMFTEWQRRYGIDLPLATLIERPTIAGLAEVLREAGVGQKGDGAPVDAGARPSWRALVTLRKGEAGTPLFLFHAVGGNVLNYRALADALEPGQPVLGLQSHGLDGAGAPLESIDAMADAYVREMIEVHPDGDFLLAGGSMGGIVALEVARRLRAAGRGVAMLAMFDTYGPGSRGMRDWRLRLRGLLPLEGDALGRILQRARLRFVRLPLHRLRARLSRRPPPLPQDLRILAVEKANFRALAAYRPRPYDGPLLLLRTRVREGEGAADMGWGRWIGGGVEVVELPGRHHDFIDQPELASRLRQCIAQAR